MLKYFIIITILLTNIFAFDAFISSSELKTALNNKNLIIIDVTDKDIYKKGHIQNAINADISNFISKDINTNPEDAQKQNNKIDIASDNTIQKELRALGINNTSKVVIYHHNTKDAMAKSAYLAFILIYSGFEDVSILDGGYMEWVFQNQILVSTKKTKNIKYGDIKITPRKELFVNTNYIKENLSKVKILDARSYQEYFGIIKSDKINEFGHIPKASNSFYKDNFFTDDILRPQQELNTIYINGHELLRDNEVIIYADNILNASMEWFIVYKKMNFKNAKIYKNSLLEWVNEKNKLTRFKWE